MKKLCLKGKMDWIHYKKFKKRSNDPHTKKLYDFDTSECNQRRHFVLNFRKLLVILVLFILMQTTAELCILPISLICSQGWSIVIDYVQLMRNLGWKRQNLWQLHLFACSQKQKHTTAAWDCCWLMRSDCFLLCSYWLPAIKTGTQHCYNTNKI